jgi:hypothetical protein
LLDSGSPAENASGVQREMWAPGVTVGEVSPQVPPESATVPGAKADEEHGDDPQDSNTSVGLPAVALGETRMSRSSRTGARVAAPSRPDPAAEQPRRLAL